MSTFTKCAATTTGSCDPTMHVNYNVGMVLGVDDFNQEFTYLSGRDKWMARDLIGYGTVWGLRVSSELDTKGPRVVVSPGVAVSPCGQMIRVPVAQCAYLNDWLTLEPTKQELTKRQLTSPPGDLKLYVVLCYRDCPTGNVPIPGEPCRSEDDLMVASRLADDFTLELRFDPPSQMEENAVRDFVLWLSQADISDTLPSTPMKDFLKAIRDAAQVVGSPPDFMFGSPPVSLVINRSDVCRYFGAAYRVWLTELRPKWRPDALSNPHGCCGGSQSDQVVQEECVLLAEVDVPVLIPSGGGNWQVSDPNNITVDEDARPFLVHLRMLQEWLLCGRNQIGSAAAPLPNLVGDVTGPVSNTTVARISGGAVGTTAPTNDQVLKFIGNKWTPATLTSAPSTLTAATNAVAENVLSTAGTPQSGGSSTTTYSRGDHTHGTPPDQLPAHRNSTTEHNSHGISGDVTGTLSNTTVVKIQGRNINVPPPPAQSPGDGQILRFRINSNPNLSGWQAEDFPTSSSVPSPSGTLTRIVAASWVHDEAGDPFTVERTTSPGIQPPRTFAIAVVAFGIPPVGAKIPDQKDVTFGKLGLDENSFQLFILERTDIASSYKRVNVGRLIVGPSFEVELIPVQITLGKSGGRAVITGAKEIASPSGATSVAANGAAMVCSRNFMNEQLLPNARDSKIFVEIRGDLIPDKSTPPVALDANFLGTLPTGDNIAGGTFWSWFTLRPAPAPIVVGGVGSGVGTAVTR